MTTKNSKSNEEKEILLQDVAKKLRSARDVAKNVPYELHDFCDYLADVSGNNDIVPEGMIMLLALALDDLKHERCGFANKVDFPESLKDENFQIIIYLRFFPLIIDKIADKKFSEELRRIFVETFGEAEPAVAEPKENFGVKIIKDYTVDISNKDKAEVLATENAISQCHNI